MRKLRELNDKQVKEKGRNIAEGTLSKIRLNDKPGKLNFFRLYFIKLTNFIDQESKNPHGQAILKGAIQNIVENIVSKSEEH